MAEEEVQENEAGAGEASDEEGGEDQDGEGGGGGLNAKKILLFVALPLFVLVGIGGGLYFTGVLDGLMGKDSGEESASAEAGEAPKKAKGGSSHGGGGDGGAAAGDAFFLEIPNMTVNLSGGDGQPRYLRLSVQLELASPGDLAGVEAVMPRVVDQFQTYLRELRVKDLRGSAGIYRLQMELLARVNAAAYPIEVKDVLFQEILIQ